MKISSKSLEEQLTPEQLAEYKRSFKLDNFCENHKNLENTAKVFVMLLFTTKRASLLLFFLLGAFSLMTARVTF